METQKLDFLRMFKLQYIMDVTKPNKFEMPFGPCETPPSEYVAFKKQTDKYKPKPIVPMVTRNYGNKPKRFFIKPFDWELEEEKNKPAKITKGRAAKRPRTKSVAKTTKKNPSPKSPEAETSFYTDSENISIGGNEKAVVIPRTRAIAKATKKYAAPKSIEAEVSLFTDSEEKSIDDNAVAIPRTRAIAKATKKYAAPKSPEPEVLFTDSEEKSIVFGDHAINKPATSEVAINKPATLEVTSNKLVTLEVKVNQQLVEFGPDEEVFQELKEHLNYFSKKPSLFEHHHYTKLIAVNGNHTIIRKPTSSTFDLRAYVLEQISNPSNKNKKVPVKRVAKKKKVEPVMDEMALLFHKMSTFIKFK